jgi:hypothetical protein
MDWLTFDLDQAHSLHAASPKVAPSSPSVEAQDGPGFRVRRSRRDAKQGFILMPPLPPALRFPEPMTLWTA